MWYKDNSLPIRLAIAEMDDLNITDCKEAYEQLEACAESYRIQYSDTAIGEVYGVQNARSFFRAIGLDPTKRRPSSESLLRRALKNKPLYSVNSFVDICNWCSLDFLLPICIYDAEKVVGDIELQKGGADDAYEALNHEIINFEGRYVFVDEEGAFGSPMTDSVRTSISMNTTHAYMVIFASDDLDEDVLQDHLNVYMDRVKMICGGEVVEQMIL